MIEKKISHPRIRLCLWFWYSLCLCPSCCSHIGKTCVHPHHMLSTAYACCSPQHIPTVYKHVYAVGICCGYHFMLWVIYRGEPCHCCPHHIHMVWTTHILWTTCYMLWRHIVWVIYCGYNEHILWGTYAVGICCGNHDDMLWGTYAVDIHCGQQNI